MSKLTMLAAGAVGYVLGTRAGRERYEQIKAKAQKVARDPRVREKANEAAHLARENAPLMKEKVVDAAHTAKEKVDDAAHTAKEKVDERRSSDDPAPVTGASTNSTYPSA